MTPDELRQQLKEQRKEDARERDFGLKPDIIASDPGTDTLSNSRERSGETNSGNGPEERHAHSSDPTVREPVKSVRGRTKRDTGYDSTTANSQGKLAGGAGSPAQEHIGLRPGVGRYGENHSEDRSNGADLRESLSRSELERLEKQAKVVPPISIGNLQRNIQEEKSIYVPPRTFDNPVPGNFPQPIVGAPALRIINGQPSNTVKQTGTARAVESLKGVIPKAKRGRPPTSTVPKDALPVGYAEPLEIRKSLGDKLKEAGQAIPQGKKLTSKEVNELKEPLIGALKDEFQMFDSLLWKYEGEQSIQQPIWSDMLDDEVEHLATALLNMGTRSATAATIARGSVDLQDYIVAGALLAPRFQSTVGLVREVRKRNKPTSARGRR